MGNTNMDLLFPEFWAASFEEIHAGKYTLQNQVSRKFDSKIAEKGDQVNVPLLPSANGHEYSGGEVTTTSDITQSTVPVILNRGFAENFTLEGKDYSLSPYDLISTYGVACAEAILRDVNKSLYLQMLHGTNKGAAVALASVDVADVINAKDALDALQVDDNNRILVMSSSVHNKFLAKSAFQYVNQSGTDAAMKMGIVDEKFGFNFVTNHAIAKYTPADVAGSCASAAANAVAIVVTAFDDDAKPVRVGDILTIADDTTEYTVTSTILTGGDTTTIGISPPLVVAITAAKVVTIVPSESMVGMHRSALALASRPFAAIPEQLGVKSSITNYKGLPIRISVWASGLVIKVQYDILYGCKLVHKDRIYRLPVK